MEENTGVNEREENRVSGEKNNLDAYPVQSLELNNRHIIELNYSGTPIITTKEMIAELKAKAEKVDELTDRVNIVVKRNRDLKEKLISTNGRLKELDELSQILLKKSEEWKAENERLKKALELEKNSHFATASKLAKFQQSPPQKKAYLSDAEIISIRDYIVQGYQQGKKITVREIHEWVMYEGRKRGDRRLAGISYETVRATVSKIKSDLGIQ